MKILGSDLVLPQPSLFHSTTLSTSSAMQLATYRAHHAQQASRQEKHRRRARGTPIETEMGPGRGSGGDKTGGAFFWA